MAATCGRLTPLAATRVRHLAFYIPYIYVFTGQGSPTKGRWRQVEWRRLNGFNRRRRPKSEAPCATYSVRYPLRLLRGAMALLYGLFWRLLLVLVHINRALVSWLRVRFRSWKGRMWERAMSALLLPLALAGFPDHQKKLNPNPCVNANPVTGTFTAGRRTRWLSDGKSLEKLPVHIGLLVTEEEPSYTDIANLVVWCMAVGISYVSVYDNHGIFRKNNSRLLEEILRQQHDLLGVDHSKNNVEFLSSNGDKQQHNVVSCMPTVKVLSPEDGKQSIVQAAQQLCRSVENHERNSKDISVSMLDVVLRESMTVPDPELVVKFGPVDSTLGFLPWHIRLTEFISLPSHRNVSYEDLLEVLQRFTSCQQRLGQ